ncbi:hypothetical protein QOT17_004071 [Balamuthia mandrillaris]
MCEFIKEFGVIDGEYDEIVTALIAHCKRDQGEFHPSELYNRLEARKHVDQGKRRSLFKTLSDGESFRLAQALVDKSTRWMAATTTSSCLSSNLLEEFTLILCVDADCEGGETVFHLNRFFTHTSKASITPKHAVLFRKDLCHEGALLRRGYKQILTFNLWATPRNSKSKSKSKSNHGKEDGKERLVVASFEGSEGQVYVMPLSNVMAFENKMAGYIRFRGLEEGRQPIINIHFGGEEEEESMGITHESFDTIYRIMMRMYVPQHQMDWQLVDYFNIDPKNVLLDVTAPSPSLEPSAESCSTLSIPEELALRPFINASDEDPQQEEDEEDAQSNKEEDESTEKKRRRKNPRPRDPHQTTKPDNATFSIPTGAFSSLLDLQQDILLVPTPEMIEYICSSCVAPNRLPYLPFLTVWVEGSYGYGGSMAGTAPTFFDMQPVFASFSQAHNLLQCIPLSTTRGKPYFPLSAKWSSSSSSASSASSSEVAASRDEMEGEAKKHPLPFWTLVRPSKEVVYANIQSPTPVRLSEQKLSEEQETSLSKGGIIFNDDDGETLLLHGSEFRWKSGQYHFGLEVACPRLNTSRLMRMLMVHHYSYTRLSNDTTLMRGELEGTTYRGPFYHLDKEGRTYLSGEQQFEATLRRLDELSFFERLLTKLANGDAKGLHFPQAKHNFTEFFCNEEVYATLKISLICGFVRMA